MVSRNYVDGGVYPFADGSERVWYKSPNEKVRPSGFVTEDEFKQLKASQRASVSEADQSKFNAAQVGLQSVNEARQMLARRPPGYSNRVAAMDAGEIDPTWLEAFFRNKGGNPSGWGGQMAQALTPLRNTAFINQIQNIQKGSPTGGGASLGNSIVEGQRLEGAFGSLAVGQDPAALGRTLSNIEGMVKTWQPGLTPANPMDLTAGQSRDTAPAQHVLCKVIDRSAVQFHRSLEQDVTGIVDALPAYAVGAISSHWSVRVGESSRLCSAALAGRLPFRHRCMAGDAGRGLTIVVVTQVEVTRHERPPG